MQVIATLFQIFGIIALLTFELHTRKSGLLAKSLPIAL